MPNCEACLQPMTPQTQFKDSKGKKFPFHNVCPKPKKSKHKKGGWGDNSTVYKNALGLGKKRKSLI